jgi:hypothetical protein
VFHEMSQSVERIEYITWYIPEYKMHVKVKVKSSLCFSLTEHQDMKS